MSSMFHFAFPHNLYCSTYIDRVAHDRQRQQQRTANQIRNQTLRNSQALPDAQALAANGTIPNQTLTDNAHMQDACKTFIQSQFNLKLQVCNLCKEYFLLETELLVCKNCSTDRGNIKKFTHQNNMDPFYHPNPEIVREMHLLPQLSEIEKML